MQAIAQVRNRLVHLRTFLADRRGVSAVEFALIFPIMLLLYIGTFETVQVISASRRLSGVGSTVGDLVSQGAQVTTADLTNIFDASGAIMLPFSTSGLKMTVSSVLVKADGTMKVTWSKTRNGIAWTVGSPPPVTVPDSMKVVGEEFIVTQVDYTYLSAFSSFTKDLWGASSVAMDRITFFRPRVTSAVVLK